MRELRFRYHGGCHACLSSDLRLDFVISKEGGLEASLKLSPHYCSYQGLMHGGVLALLLDEAMTCVLFALGVVAVTGRLQLRYRLPVIPDVEMKIHSWPKQMGYALHVVEAVLSQCGQTAVKARADFVNRALEESGSLSGSPFQQTDSNLVGHEHSI